MKEDKFKPNENEGEEMGMEQGSAGGSDEYKTRGSLGINIIDCTHTLEIYPRTFRRGDSLYEPILPSSTHVLQSSLATKFNWTSLSTSPQSCCPIYSEPWIPVE